MNRVRYLPSFALLYFVLAAWPGHAANLLTNPGFEPPAKNGVAQGWVNNSWGDCQTVFSLDPVNPHSGKTSQKIQCLRRTAGASQFLQPLKLLAGKRYRVSLWVRAAGNVPWVGASLRQSPAPYTAHLAATYEPGRNWELFQFEGTNASAEDNAGLYIWFQAAGSGTVWVDDASVQIVKTPSVSGPPPQGNVLPNGSFELDPTRTWDNSGVTGERVTGHAAHGTHSLHFSLPAQGNFKLTTPCLPFNGDNEKFTLACSAQATGGPVTLAADVWSADRIGQGPSMLHLQATPGASMQRFTSSEKLPVANNGAYFVTVQGHCTQAAELWLDAVSLSPKGPAYEPAAPLQAALSTTELANIFAPNEPVRMKLEAFNGGPAYTGDLLVRVRDFREATVCERRFPARLAAGSGWAQEIVLPVNKLGAFRADVFATNTQRPLASMVFSVIPEPANVPAARSVVGGHFSTASDWQMKIARRLGYKWTRIHDCSTITHWASVEPEKGHWHFFDADVARVRKAGLAILGEFLRVPAWATLAKPGTWAYRTGGGPFRSMDEFTEYVRTVVNHYKHDIHYWEIWNEPYGKGFWSGTAEQYAALAKAAARAAKAADPTCTLLAPCTYPSAREWTEKVIADGGLSGADIFSYHGYGCLDEAPYDVINSWAHKDGRPMPRWNTETGVTAKTFYRYICDRLDNNYTRRIGGVSVPEAVQESLKLFVLTIASGAQRYFYYWTNVEPGMCPRMTSMSIYEYDRTIRPHGVVYAIAASLLDPCQGAGVRRLPGGLVACLLQRDQESVAVLWAQSRLSTGVVALRDLPAGTRVLDVMGNPTGQQAGGKGHLQLTKEPVYLIAPHVSAQDLGNAVEKSVVTEK